MLTDGRDLCVYADRNGEGELYLWQVIPPYDRLVFGDDDLEVDLTRRGVKSRKGDRHSSEPLRRSRSAPATLRRIEPGHLLSMRQGAVLAESRPTDADAASRPTRCPRRHPVAARPAKAEVRQARRPPPHRVPLRARRSSAARTSCV